MGWLGSKPILFLLESEPAAASVSAGAGDGDLDGAVAQPTKVALSTRAAQWPPRGGQFELTLIWSRQPLAPTSPIAGDEQGQRNQRQRTRMGHRKAQLQRRDALQRHRIGAADPQLARHIGASVRLCAPVAA